MPYAPVYRSRLLIFNTKIYIMSKYYLMSQMKSTGTAYLCWFLIGCHYAYLGKWGLQILYWITIGGFGLWALFDLFHIPTKVNNYNFRIAEKIEALEGRQPGFSRASSNDYTSEDDLV